MLPICFGGSNTGREHQETRRDDWVEEKGEGDLFVL